MTKQTWTAAVAALLFVALAALIAMVPVPFVTWTPGSTYNLLGDIDGTPAIEISGAPTFATNGEIRMTTVSVTRPDSALTLPEALFSYWLPSREVMPRDVVYPPGKGPDAIEESDTLQMDASQSTAVVAALRAAAVRVQELPMVTSVSAAGPSAGSLEPGDLINYVDNVDTPTIDSVREQIAKHHVGEVVKLDVLREGNPLSFSITTVAGAKDPGAPVIGIGLAVGYIYDPTVTFGVSSDIGGPSAGLPFALAIYEMLTNDPVLGGRIVAGTGQIDAAGHVFEIGGVQEKIAGAARDGAAIFLLPRVNCRDVVESHDSIRLVPVDDLGEAISALKKLDNPATAGSVAGC